MSYFVGLNYSLANEDSRIEHRLVPDQTGELLAVAGSGARVLPLLAKAPSHATIIDVSREQLFISELRCAAARSLDRDRFLQLLGYRSIHGAERERLFSKLDLSRSCRDFWADGVAIWRDRGWIWLGRWENHFLRINKVLRTLLGSQIDRIFEASSVEEQAALFDELWRPRVFRAFLKVVASEFIFDRVLYRGHFSGRKDQRTEIRPPWQFFEDEFYRIFRTQMVRENYFFQLLFLGELRFAEGLPFEADPTVLAAVARAKTEIRFVREDLITHTQSRPYSFYSLSDTFSYFSEESARGFLDRFHLATPEGAIAVMRSFLRSPGGLQFRSWNGDASLEREAERDDITGVYRFHIFRKKSLGEAE